MTEHGGTSFSFFSTSSEQICNHYEASVGDHLGATWPSWDFDLISFPKTKNVETELALVIRSAIPTPPLGYICKECNIVGDHYSSRCPETVHDGLTSYEGDKRSFGLFKCPHCYKKWYSYHSYKDVGKECSKCRRGLIYPYKMYDLKNEAKISEAILKIKSKSH